MVCRASVTLSFLWALLPAAHSVAGDPATTAGRPNILFCFADDWGQYASAYRAAAGDRTPNTVVHTPHFDRVAREGVLFNQAYVNAPSCTPCRSALLSGQYFFRTGRGAILSGAVWDAAIPSYPLILRESGYHIGHSYKVWSPGTPRNAPYGAAAHGYNQAGNRFNRFSQFVSEATDQEAAKRQLLDEVRDNFRAFEKKRSEGQPFCYWFGPTNCHRKWVRGSGKQLWGLDPDDLQGKLPPFLPDNATVREDFCDYLGEVQAFDAAVGMLLDELQQLGELENTLIVVSGDHGIPGFPRGKCNLYDFGVHVALAIRWGERVSAGRVVNDFINLMDLAPTFLQAAGVPPPEVMTGRSLVDVLRSDRQGLVDPSRDYVVVGRERHVDTARLGNLPYPQRAIRTADFLYIRNFKPQRWPMGVAPGFGQPDGPLPAFDVLANDTRVAFADLDASPTKAALIEQRQQPGMRRYFEFAFARRPAEELYDLRRDPHQMNNVAEDPDYAADRHELADRLLSVLQRAGDPRVAGDGSTFDKPPFTTTRARPARAKGRS